MFTAAIVSIALFALVVAIVRFVAGRTSDWLSAVYGAPTMLPRPRGVQEEDLPAFVFRDVPAPRHAPTRIPASFRVALQSSV